MTATEPGCSDQSVQTGAERQYAVIVSFGVEHHRERVSRQGRRRHVLEDTPGQVELGLMARAVEATRSGGPDVRRAWRRAEVRDAAQVGADSDHHRDLRLDGLIGVDGVFRLLRAARARIRQQVVVVRQRVQCKVRSALDDATASHRRRLTGYVQGCPWLRTPAQPCPSFAPRRRSALKITEAELRLIARAAISGDSSQPVTGNSTPAASGTPSAL